MRKYLSENLKNGLFLHADMWRLDFPPENNIKVIDFGLAEPTLINAAAGMYLNNQTVYIYGVAGFLIHRMEQIKYYLTKVIQENQREGKVIIFNAGKIGYEKFTTPHKLDNDIKLLKEIYNIEVFDPYTLEELNDTLKQIEDNDIKISYVRLGKDF